METVRALDRERSKVKSERIQGKQECSEKESETEEVRKERCKVVESETEESESEIRQEKGLSYMQIV